MCCVRLCTDVYCAGVDRLQALDMVGHVRRSFHEILQQLTWLEDSTKKVAQEKVGTSRQHFILRCPTVSPRDILCGRITITISHPSVCVCMSTCLSVTYGLLTREQNGIKPKIGRSKRCANF